MNEFRVYQTAAHPPSRQVAVKHSCGHVVQVSVAEGVTAAAERAIQREARAVPCARCVKAAAVAAANKQRPHGDSRKGKATRRTNARRKA